MKSVLLFKLVSKEEDLVLVKTMEVQITELEATALLDSAATCSIMSFQFFQKIKNNYPPAKLEVSGMEYSKIKTVDGTEVRYIKEKLDITMRVHKTHEVTISVFILKNCPYDLIVGQNILNFSMRLA